MIAEISCNHMGQRDILDSTVRAAFSANADAVKLQSSEPNCLTRKFKGPEFKVDSSESPWHGMHLWELYEKTCTPIDWPVEEIIQARSEGKIVFSTPFSPKMVSLLESNAKPELYKVSSIDWNYFELIEKCLTTGKQVIISLVKPSTQLPLLKRQGFKSLIPLYCISKYPASPLDFNIEELKFLSKKASSGFGFSDHSLGPGLASLAISYGATIVEKHFKLNNKIQSEDSHFSATPDEFSELVSICHDVFLARRSKSNKTTIPIGRSIYIDHDVKAGEVIKREHLCIIRPGGGLSPENINHVIGSKAMIDLPRGLRLQDSHFS
jgi:sialic acid synthase SpsE